MIDGELKVTQEDAVFKIEGHLASDGSCSGGEWITSLARAGWAVVQAEPGTGKTQKVIYGAVLHPAPQSAQAGEWLAAAVAAQSAIGSNSALTSIASRCFAGSSWLGRRSLTTTTLGRGSQELVVRTRLGEHQGVKED